MKFLITGGSGFLGINLVRFLLQKKQEVVVLDIADFDYPDVRPEVVFVKGDIRNSSLIPEMMTKYNIDIVVHAAAALPLYKKEDIFSTDVFGTENVLKASREAGISRVIHISSTAVYGIPDHHPLLEDDLRSGVGHYGEAKVKAEQICEHFRKEGLCVSILRPKSFVGPERLGVLAIFYDWVKSGKNVPILGSGKNKYQLLDVEDLCEAIWLCATKEEQLVNDTFNIGASKFTTMKEDFGAVLDFAGHQKKIIPLPALPVIYTLKALELLRLSPLYKWIYETACADSYVSLEKAEKKLGFAPKYSNKQALIRNYQWYNEHHQEYHQKTGISHRVPWKQGILKVAKMFF